MAPAGYRLRAALFEDGPTRILSEDEARQQFASKEGLLWINITAEERDETRAMLTETFGFHPLEVEDALSSYERPTLRADESSAFLVAPAVILGGDTERFVEVAFFVNHHCIVTVASDQVGLLEHWFDRCAEKPHASGRKTSTLLHSLLDGIVDGYFPAVDSLGDDIDKLEESIYAGVRVEVADALQIKRQLLELRRQITPIRDILNGLLRRDVTFLDAEAHAYFQDVYDHSLRITEVIDMERDILSSVLDAHLAVVSNNLNQVMRTLTVISTVLMTGAFVAGVYGMNFKFMPELDWRLGYPFAFILMIGAAWLEVWFFKKKGWI